MKNFCRHILAAVILATTGISASAQVGVASKSVGYDVIWKANKYPLAK